MKLAFLSFTRGDLNGKKCTCFTNWYTGEDGFEIYCDAKMRRTLEGNFRSGKRRRVIPCGLGARDTLRFEATLALIWPRIIKRISPLEAGIGFAVKLNKEADFIGKEALRKQKENGTTTKTSWN